VAETMLGEEVAEQEGIEGDGDVEWLHRSAFSFGRLKMGKTGTPQTVRNMVWGTAEVNTAMIRAESFVKRLARRTKNTVQVTTSIEYTDDTDWIKPLKYTWLAPILCYRIVGTGRRWTQLGGGSKKTCRCDFNYKLRFWPFERLMPNLLEYHLDKLVEKLIYPWDVSQETDEQEEKRDAAADD
ncbi:hypothetical protein SISNIDRAFT_455991, partial [Sistotremastrum niveocremeum HHB9708]